MERPFKVGDIVKYNTKQYVTEGNRSKRFKVLGYLENSPQIVVIVTESVQGDAGRVYIGYHPATSYELANVCECCGKPLDEN